MLIDSKEELAQDNVNAINSNCYHQPEEKIGDMFKVDGWYPLGPYGTGDFTRLLPTTTCPQYTEMNRYEYVCN